jgi:glycerol-3-phosphate dehydrogenase
MSINKLIHPVLNFLKASFNWTDQKVASEISRKDEIFESQNGLLSIAGGKLTGYRKMAEKIVNLTAFTLKEKHQSNFKDCHTDQIHFKGGPFRNEHEVDVFRLKIEERISQIGLDKYYASYLVSNYGKQAEIILDRLEELKGDDSEIKLGLAELWFGIHNELVFSSLDFFMRRTGRLYFDIMSINKLIHPVLNFLKASFNWTDQKVASERPYSKV